MIAKTNYINYSLKRQGSQSEQEQAIAVLQQDLLAAIVIEVGEREGAAVLKAVKARYVGDFGKGAVAVVGEEHVAFLRVP